jgi:hypothetical protein
MQINQPQPTQPAMPAPTPNKALPKALENELKDYDKGCIHPKLCDQTEFERLPGKIKPPVIQLSEVGKAERLIDDTLSTALYAKMPFAREQALRSMERNLRNMTPGQLDDVKDAIVKRMASPDASQRERDVLKDMYELTDAIAENRQATPGHKILPRPIVPPTLDNDEKAPFRQVEPPIFADPPVFKKY